MKLSTLRQLPEKTRDYLMVIPAAAIYFILWPLTGEAKAFASGMVFGVFCVLISRSWDKRSDKKFWLILFVFVVLHIAGLWLINFPHLRAGLEAFPFALADGFAMWGVLNWAVPEKSASQS